MVFFFKTLNACIVTLLLSNTAFGAEWNVPPHQFSVSSQGHVPQVGADSLGNAIAIWEDFDVCETVILSSFFNKNLFAWSPSVLISNPGADAPALKMGSSGIALGAFRNAGTSAIEANVYKDGWLGIESFSEEGTLSRPLVAVNSSGVGVIAWISSVTGVRAVTYNGSVFSDVQTIDTQTTLTTTPLSLAINDSGKAVLVWTDAVGAIRFSQLEGTNWTTSSKITQKSDNSFVNIGIDAAGTSIVVFQRGNKIYFKKNSSGVWTNTILISKIDEPGEFSFNTLPKLAVDAGGTAVAIWRRADASTLESSFYDGMVWNLSRVVSIDPSSEYDLVGDNLTNTLVIYSLQNDSSYQLNSVFYNPGLDWSAPKKIISSDAPLGKPSIAISSTYHTAFAVWEAGGTTDTFGSFSPLMIPPSPPSSLTARLKKDRFPSQTNRIHVLKWNQTSDPTALFYRLKQGKKVILEFPLNGQSEITLHNREKKEAAETYSLSAVNALGEEGAPKKISIR